MWEEEGRKEEDRQGRRGRRRWWRVDG